MSGRGRAAASGAVAAAIWAALEPLDQRLLRCDYSDVALLGKLVTTRRAWRPIGLSLHLANGAAFGLGYEALARRTRMRPGGLALRLALAEHVALWPLCALADRWHPARGTSGVPPLLTNRRAFGQATVRHAVFGLALGRLAA